MHAQCAPAAVGQHVEIATRLRRLDDAETGLLAGHGEILGLIGGDLQEYAAVGPALVGLSGGMQEARSELRAGRDVTFVANRKPDVLQRVDMGVVPFDIGEQRDIVARPGAAQVSLQPRSEIAIGAGLPQRAGIFIIGEQLDRIGRDHRRLLGQRAGFLECGGELARFDLGGLDVGLVERVDAEHGAGDGRGDLEAEEFLADVVDRFHRDTNHGVSGLFQRGEPVIVASVTFTFGAKVDEETIPAVDDGLAERLAVDRDQPLAVLAGGFRDQLFGPGAEVGDLL